MISVRAATLADLPGITEIHNHYVLHTHITFDVAPWQPDQRVTWFHEHSGDGRYRMLVACDEDAAVPVRQILERSLDGTPAGSVKIKRQR